MAPAMFEHCKRLALKSYKSALLTQQVTLNLKFLIRSMTDHEIFEIEYVSKFDSKLWALLVVRENLADCQILLKKRQIPRVRMFTLANCSRQCVRHMPLNWWVQVELVKACWRVRTVCWLRELKSQKASRKNLARSPKEWHIPS